MGTGLAMVTVMQHSSGLRVSLSWAAGLIMGVALASPPTRAAPQTADTPPADVVTGAWQHHKASFTYFGVTTLYSCDGLEGQVGQILRHLGARKDVHVSAHGCPGASYTPSTAPPWMRIFIRWPRLPVQQGPAPSMRAGLPWK